MTNIRVGTIGGGQLAMMLAEAGEKIGIELYALVENKDCPAYYAANLIVGDQHNAQEVENFSKQIDVITFEFENVDFETFKNVTTPIYPNLNALKIAQDREQEKMLFQKQNVPTTNFMIAHNAEELATAIKSIGIPCVIKTCRDGYDGKGQKVIRGHIDAQLVWQELGGKRLIIENLVAFEREVSLIAVRGRNGETAFYPLTENQHEDGILRISKAPYKNDTLQKKAQQYLDRLLTAMNYVGVLTVEFFVVGEELIANEMAPRVHNSGHWTIEGAKTSQFENHLRAVCGLPLGSTEVVGQSTMINIIGTMPDIQEYQNNPQAYIHDYHKTERAGRKLAHVTVIA